MHSQQVRVSATPSVQPYLHSPCSKTVSTPAAGPQQFWHRQHQSQQQQQQQQHQQQQDKPQAQLIAQQPGPAAYHQEPYQQQEAAAQPSRRRCVLMLAAAAALLGPGFSTGSGAALASVPSSRAGDNVEFLTDSQVDKQRKKANFKRSHDGHVALLNRFSKQWTDVKCDLQVPGLLLLREASGQVFYLGYAGLKQVDLSDDQVVAAVAADDWENSMTLVQAETADGGVEALELTREEFYSLVSLVSSEDWNTGSSKSPNSLDKAPNTAAAATATAAGRAAAAGKAR